MYILIVRVFVLQCGNGIKEEGEECDVVDLGNDTCQTLHRSV